MVRITFLSAVVVGFWFSDLKGFEMWDEIDFQEFNAISPGLVAVSAGELFGGGSYVEYDRIGTSESFRYESKPTNGNQYVRSEKWFQFSPSAV